MVGVVEEVLPKNLYRVRCNDGRVRVASLHRLIRRLAVSLLPGRSVVLEPYSYDTSRGRIVEFLPKTHTEGQL